MTAALRVLRALGRGASAWLPFSLSGVGPCSAVTPGASFGGDALVGLAGSARVSVCLLRTRGRGRAFLDSWPPFLKRVPAVLVGIWTLLIHRQGWERDDGGRSRGGMGPATYGGF